MDEIESAAVQALVANDPTWWQAQRARAEQDEFDCLVASDNA